MTRTPTTRRPASVLRRYNAEYDYFHTPHAKARSKYQLVRLSDWAVLAYCPERGALDRQAKLHGDDCPCAVFRREGGELVDAGRGSGRLPGYMLPA